jgi:4-hydroxybenzoate polyprenyltransferase
MAWIKLLRIAALPSALSNILVGYLLANESWQPSLPLVFLLMASACLYCAGMVLNDVFDFEVDREQRPNSPLPSGTITLSLARNVGFGLLVLGPIFAAFASAISMGVAIALAIAIFLYDGPLKRTAAAPILMGACRMLNIILGASSAAAIPEVIYWYAAAIGVFVAGITWLARREAEKSQSLTQLVPGSVAMVAGLLLLVYVSWTHASQDGDNARLVKSLPLAMGFICLPILRRLTIALSTASGRAVKSTVITSLRSLLVFDACMALLVENGRPVFSIAILALLALSWWLGRMSRTT